MIYLRSIEKRGGGGSGYPMDTLLLQQFGKLDFTSPVTILCGDNGCGKTTLVELIASKVRAHRIDGQETPTDARRRLMRASDAMRAAMSGRPQHCFLFTAEGFSKYVDYIVAEKQFARNELDELDGKFANQYARDLASQPYQATLGALEGMYKGHLEEQSHGQGFLDFFKSRIAPGGLYLMDEPEAALSYINQLALIYLIQDAVRDGCQFILATHSPILTAITGASIWEMHEGQLLPKAYDQLQSIQFLKYFMQAHEHILKDDE